MTDPIVPSLEDILPGLHTPADDATAALAAAPAGYPRIVPAGEDLSTLNPDTMTSVRDSRTPDEFLPVERILADRLDTDPNHLRLLRAHISDFGAITLWEALEPSGVLTAGHYVASYVVGAGRLQIVYARKLDDGLLRYQKVCLDHEALPEATP